MTLIEIKNLKKKYEDAGVKQALVDLYTQQRFFVIDAFPGRIAISDQTLDSLSDLLDKNFERPFFLSFISKNTWSHLRSVKVEEFMEIVGAQQQGANSWILYTKEIKDNFEIIKRLSHLNGSIKNGLPKTKKNL